MLRVDDREHALIERLRYGKVKFEVARLPLGDIVIENQGVTAVLERKRTDDFAASITDGRWREQKARLAQSGCIVIYIIEGSLYGQSKPAATLSSAIWNTMLRDKMWVLQTRDTQDTAMHLQQLVGKIGVHIHGGTGMRSLLSKRKRKCENAWQLMLMAIPSVSERVATAIVDKYPTLLALQQQLRDNPQALRDIHISAKRRVGPRTIEHLSRYLMGDPAGLPSNGRI